jgi:hypothetical protein
MDHSRLVTVVRREGFGVLIVSLVSSALLALRIPHFAMLPLAVVFGWSQIGGL